MNLSVIRTTAWLVFLAAPAASLAQAYPTKPVRVMVPASPDEFAAALKPDMELHFKAMAVAGIKQE